MARMGRPGDRRTVILALALLGTVTLQLGTACAGPGAASPPPASPETVSRTAGSPDGGQPDLELELGKEVYEQLKAQGTIVATSPLYAQLEPIAARITRAAQPRYEHPFHFYLVHQQQPNAFSTPGGNVYVADSLLYFVKNTEELAGTICHEVSHTIHHDTVTLIQKREGLVLGGVGASVLLGPTVPKVLAIALVTKLNALGYSREAESRADVTGSDICAEARYNPWGLVWLFTDFANSKMGETPELLSDHPNDEHRVRTLKEHFRQNPGVFSGFDSDPGSSTPLHVPAEMDETFDR